MPRGAHTLEKFMKAVKCHDRLKVSALDWGSWRTGLGSSLENPTTCRHLGTPEKKLPSPFPFSPRNPIWFSRGFHSPTSTPTLLQNVQSTQTIRGRMGQQKAASLRNPRLLWNPSQKEKQIQPMARNDVPDFHLNSQEKELTALS